MTPNKAIDQILKENKLKKIKLSAMLGKSRLYVGKTLMNPNMEVATIINMLSLIGDGYELAIQKKDPSVARGNQIVLDMASDQEKKD